METAQKQASVRFKLNSTPTPNGFTQILVKVQFAFKLPSERAQLAEELAHMIDNPKRQYLARPSIKHLLTLPHKEAPKYKPVIISTGLSLPATFFDVKSQTCSGIYADYNERLVQIKTDIEALYLSLTKKCAELKPDFFKAQIKAHILNGKPKKDVVNGQKVSLVASHNIVKWLKQKTKAHLADKNIKPGTAKNYNKFMEWLIKYETEKNIILDFDTLTLDSLREFKEWILTLKSPQSGKPYKLNYVTWFMTMWKTLIKEARVEDGIPVQVMLDSKFLSKKRKTERSESVYLTMQQLDKIKKLKFDVKNPDWKKRHTEELLQTIRNSFIFNCQNGFRISDHKECRYLFQEGKELFFRISRTTKTGAEEVKIPLYDQWCIKYWNKYKILPELGNREDYSKGISTLCERAGFDNIIQIRTINPNTMELNKPENVKFFELTSSKTARKTACSNWIRHYKVPVPVAMEWSTHTSEAVFKSYIGLSKDEYYRLAVEQMDKKAS